MDTCQYCKKQIKSEELQSHEFICVSSFKDEIDFSNKIPCEICNDLIDFDDYSIHLNECTINASRRRLNNYNMIFNELNGLQSNINPSQQNIHQFQYIIPFNNINIPNNEPLENLPLDNEPLENLPLENQPLENLPLDNEPLDEGNENININVQNNLNNIQQNIQLINSFLNNYNSILNYDNVQPNSYESLMELEEQNVKKGCKIEDFSTIIKINEDNKCPICFENYKVNDEMLKTKCEHLFCEECLKEWCEDNNKCPVCTEEFC